MLVRVLIERHFKQQHESEGIKTILEMRRGATAFDGYVSGETLTDSNDPCTIIIVSTWHSKGHWEAWEASQNHKTLANKIKPWVDKPYSVRVFVNPWDALLE